MFVILNYISGKNSRNHIGKTAHEVQTAKLEYLIQKTLKTTKKEPPHAKTA